MMLGPAVGGWLGTVSLAAPFFITAAFCLLTLAVIALSCPNRCRPRRARRCRKRIDGS